MLLLLRLTASLCEKVPLFHGCYPLCRKQQQQFWNDKKFWILLEWQRGSLFWQWIALECCWMLNKRCTLCAVCGALFLICIWEGCLRSLCLWDMFNTNHPPSQKAMPEWSCDLCRVFKDTLITCEEGWNYKIVRKRTGSATKCINC